MASVQDDPFGVLTEDAEFYELPGDLEEILPPFEAGLVLAAGRALAVLAYRDAAAFGDEPFDRDAPGAAGTVLALLPPACDRLDRGFRAGVARALWDLAEDVSVGRAPLPRCAAEAWALACMIDSAPALFAAEDEELAALGVAVPDEDDEGDYRPPYWEEAWQLIIEGAKSSIPEAQPVSAGDDEEGEVPAEPDEGWDAPRFWFSPYSITAPRDEGRGHPAWAQRHLDGGPLQGPPPLTAGRAAELLHLETSAQARGRAPGGDERDQAGAAGERGFFGDEVDGVLSPLAARLLAAAADQVAEEGWGDLFHYGDRVFERPDDEDDDPFEEDSFLGSLPPLCDGQSAAWRLAMVQAVENLAGDLRAGRAPNASCTAEELALHLIVAQAKYLVDLLDDEDYAQDMGLPSADRISVRHRAFDHYLETYLQDFDVLMHYESRFEAVVTDPEHPASVQLGLGDMRPRAWFAPFGNTRPRTPRPPEPWLLDRLADADPAAFAASTPALAREDPETTAPAAVDLPDGLREEFERFVGLGQRRFFDQPTAIAMAVSVERLLTLFFAVPTVVPGEIWPLNPRATAVHAGWLLVDDDFSLRGLSSAWRLGSDRTDAQARAWACELLLDCANYALANHQRPYTAMLRGTPPPPPLDPALAAVLEERLGALARDMTAAGTLRHRMEQLGITTAHLARAAIVPESLVAAWLAGAPASPSQLIRCAPALRMSEDVLLDALAGKRDRHRWPLPEPAPDQLGDPEPGQATECV